MTQTNYIKNLSVNLYTIKGKRGSVKGLNYSLAIFNQPRSNWLLLMKFTSEAAFFKFNFFKML